MLSGAISTDDSPPVGVGLRPEVNRWYERRARQAGDHVPAREQTGRHGGANLTGPG